MLFLVFQSRDQHVVKKASILADMHIRSLRQKMTLLQMTEESVKKLEVGIAYLLFITFS
jgi:FMRP KH0 domain